MSPLRIPGLIGAVVFAAFVAFAFLSPATYRATAQIGVESGAGAADLPAPLEAARRLHEAVLDRHVLEGLTRAGSKTVAEVQSALEIDTSDSKNFSISYSDDAAAQAQRICNQLARHAVDRAPAALAEQGKRSDQSIEAERQRRTQELTTFLATHPEVLAESSSAGKTSSDSDRMTLALRAERARLEQKLLSAAEVGPAKSDNPYVDPAESPPDPSTLRRRMAEIDTALSLRQKAASQGTPASAKVSSEVLAEWRRLVQALAEMGAREAPSAASGPALTARLVSEASRPSWPIDPDRPLLLLLGLLAGVGAGALAFFGRRLASIGPTAAPPGVPALGPPALMPPPEPPRHPRIATLAYGTLAYQPDLGDGDQPANTAPAPEPQPRVSGGDFSSTEPVLVAAPAQGSAPVPSRQPEHMATLAHGTPVHQFGAEALPTNEVDGARELEPVADVHGTNIVDSPAEREPAAAPRLEPTPTFSIGPSRTIEAPRSDGGSATPAHAAADEWEAPAFAPADPKFAAVLDAAAEAVRASDPRASLSEQPPAAVISEPPASPPKPTYAFEGRPPPPPEQPSWRPIRGKVTQRLGSLPAPAEFEMPQASRIPTPKGYSQVSVTPSPPEAWIVTIVKAPPQWRPEIELLPESRHELREQLYPFAVDGCFVIAVSAVAEVGENKSRLAAELALALAESGHPRILLMEGNFHQPAVHRLMRIDMPPQMGFSQQLHARISGGRERWTVVECQKSLHVLAEGLMRSPGLLLSKQFESCLIDLRAYYDLIVVDGPPISLEVDCRALDAVADALLIACPKAGSPDLVRARSAFSEKRFSAVVPIG